MIDQMSTEFALPLLLDIAELSRSSFYYHKAKLNAVDKYAELKQRICQIYDQHKGRYGYRRITLALKQQGLHHNHKLIARLMRGFGLISLIRRKKYNAYKGTSNKIVKNKLKRNFEAKRPNKRWLTDITEFKVADTKLYLSPILDCYNNEIVSYTLSRRPVFQLVKDMLDQAISHLPNSRKHKLMLHSDQGWHYQMSQFRSTLKANKIKQSMSRKGNCWDNALMESFFGTLKSETIYLEKPESIEVLEQQIHDYIHYYNHERIQIKLKGLSPVQFRTQSSV
ncbi:IS3 family transposase, partial [Acinetobacter bereziniae]